MLYHKETPNEKDQISIVIVTAHEIAHQWFGNLATIYWWDELWLNEGFATWISHYATDIFYPEWNVWAFFSTSLLTFGYQMDALHSSHVVHIQIDNGLQVGEGFDAICYCKGCAVIRMLAMYTGPEIFIKGVSNYLKANMYTHANAASLWKALQNTSGKDVAAMAKSWIYSAGHPVVSVKELEGGNTIAVSQSRFLSTNDLKPEEDTTTWHVPLEIKGVTNGSGLYLTSREDMVSGIDPEFYLINSLGACFYRVAYPPSRLHKLSTQLDRLEVEDRVSIISSTTSLAVAGVCSVTSVVRFLQGFRNEAVIIVWEQINLSMQSIYSVFGDDVELRDGLQNFVWRLLDDNLAKYDFEAAPGEDFLMRELRRFIYLVAVNFYHPV